ncbi:hypothetical protein TBLA_0E03040 [Henningerozyma blattae CBS 6284]|uniref:YMC020W-like alpha/beta hydrolase domain-containing protein n=1 Tax=Henningerozyma blattae (strain ATCC 34711 / CBS 6284 / DSM 70876 / NBRC 10599 / NRRL Y-10934 / UCD 77-7) TaxID=1071380 RepID=I2H4Q6_HENB6|nr:hypothetical protein TBLA_0E03040 [Tetrapisispora blattae CBS 6284]CCH61358.1 hypothetical protein TBLA_0E03040 [Tetrapisispora blattae CBS 6284]
MTDNESHSVKNSLQNKPFQSDKLNNQAETEQNEYIAKVETQPVVRKTSWFRWERSSHGTSLSTSSSINATNNHNGNLIETNADTLRNNAPSRKASQNSTSIETPEFTSDTVTKHSTAEIQDPQRRRTWSFWHKNSKTNDIQGNSEIASTNDVNLADQRSIANSNSTGSDQNLEPQNPNSLTNILIPPQAYKNYLEQLKIWKENNPDSSNTNTNNSRDNKQKSKLTNTYDATILSERADESLPSANDLSINSKEIPSKSNRSDFATSANIKETSRTSHKDVYREGVHSNKDDTEPYFQPPNLVVPGLEILPVDNTWSSITNSLNNISAELKLTNRTGMPSTLSRKAPLPTLFNITEGQQRPLNILIVGVHGFFPTKIFRKVFGEPTGTSTKFINEAEAAITKYFESKDFPIKVSKIALEREGKIFDRVDYFFEVMKSWIDEINKSDYIYFAAHSQGCPVTFMLLGRLIETGLLSLDVLNYYENEEQPYKKTKKIISILAMNGINNGPFYGADQTLLVRSLRTIEQDSFMELFQFQNFESDNSKELLRTLKIVFDNDVKVTFVGTVNDQLVPLYSSMCSFIHHPNIFRATFIDKKSNTPDFITRVLKDAGILINLGYSDRSMIKEISSSLEGTLTGGGHSSAYHEWQVYDLAIKFSLETDNLKERQPLIYLPYKLDKMGTNVYRLPWCMRSFLYEVEKHLGQSELIKLQQEYNEWHPITQQEQDIKFRLAGLRSLL